MIEAVKLEADIYPAGPRGLSAYEIYKKEGGQLSEEEWLKSLNGLTPTIGENGNWFLGTVDTGLPSRGPKGDTGSIKFIVVTELPTENIDETAIYLKPVESPKGENNFEELIYVNGKWEDLGTPNVAVDLSNYYTKNDVDNKLSTISKVYYWEEGNTGEESIAIFQEMINDLINGGNPILSNKYSNDSSASADYRIGGSNIYTFPTDLDITTLSTYTGEIDLRRFGYSTVGVTSGKVSRTWVYYKIMIVLKNGVVEKIAGPFKSTAYFNNNSWEGNNTTTILCSENTMAYTPTSDYNPATKKYVDDNVKTYTAGNNIEISDDNVINCTINENTLYIGPISMNSTMINLNDYKDALTTLINNNLDKAIYIVVKGYNDKILFGTYSFATPVTTGSTYVRFLCTFFDSTSNRESFSAKKINITYEHSVDTKLYTVTDFNIMDNISIPFAQDVLTKTNTSSYTPTANYHPATKKYVDDQVGNINTILATLTTVSEVSE